MNCIFCKIVEQKAQAHVYWDNDHFIAFKDKRPQALYHVLVTPKRHIETLDQLRDQDEFCQFFAAVRTVAVDVLKLKGYKIVIHVGKSGGQSVMHLHAHILASERGYKQAAE